jgi:uroporphyrinogen-III synthase
VAGHVHDRRDIKLISTLGFLVGAEVERARLEDEVTQLSEQLEVRKLVERAKGVLQRDLRLSEEEAYRRLQRQSRQMRKSLEEVAEAVIISDSIKRSQ